MIVEYRCQFCARVLPSSKDLVDHEGIHRRFPQLSAAGTFPGEEQNKANAHYEASWALFRAREARVDAQWALDGFRKSMDEERAHQKEHFNMEPEEVEEREQFRHELEKTYLEHIESARQGFEKAERIWRRSLE